LLAGGQTTIIARRSPRVRTPWKGRSRAGLAGRTGPNRTERTLTAIAALYDAALDERLWPDALAKLTHLTASQASSFWVLDNSQGSRLSTFLSINFDGRAIAEYLGGMASLDPTVRHLLAHPQHAVVHDGMLGPGDDEDTRTYLDWHERNVEARFRLVGQSDLGSYLQAGIALHRTRSAGRYDPQDIAQFALVHKHLQRALAVGLRLGSLASTQRITADLLDRNVAAVVLLDEQLQALLARTLGLLQSGHSSGEVFRVSRPSGRQLYALRISAVARPPVALTAFRPAGRFRRDLHAGRLLSCESRCSVPIHRPERGSDRRWHAVAAYRDQAPATEPAAVRSVR
jgi:hypothetical protein